jgi:hypothetical protein
MEAVREALTDERLDDLNHRVDRGFTEMRGEFQALRGEMREESRAVRAEIGAMHRSITQLTFGLVGTMAVGFLATIAAILSQI